MLESVLQRKIIDWLEKEGWYVVKIIQTNKNGWPDLQAMRYGCIIFIEVKSESGEPSELQLYRHRQLRDNGFHTIITNQLNQFKNDFITISQKLRI
jgi:Holliday junction resolvase-like predicted endonuclease